MAYCVKCGVELDENLKKCPLCDTKIIYEEAKSGSGRKYPDQMIETVVHNYTTEKNYKLALEIITVLLFVPFFIIMSIDMILTQNFTWSRLPLLAIVYTWMACFYPLVFHDKALIIVAGEVLSVTTFIALIDYLWDFSFEWFFQIAVPTLISLVILVSLITYYTVHSKRKGLNVMGVIIGSAGFFCFIEEQIISYNMLGRLNYEWSLFALFPCLIISVSMLIIHYRVKNFDSCKRYFDM